MWAHAHDSVPTNTCPYVCGHARRWTYTCVGMCVHVPMDVCGHVSLLALGANCPCHHQLPACARRALPHGRGQAHREACVLSCARNGCGTRTVGHCWFLNVNWNLLWTVPGVTGEKMMGTLMELKGPI